MKDESLLKQLSREERRAFIAWFRGGNFYVTQYITDELKDRVFMGKSECEQVPFSEFWLKKLPDIGLITMTEYKRGNAMGMTGQPEFIVFQISATDLGMKEYNNFNY